MDLEQEAAKRTIAVSATVGEPSLHPSPRLHHAPMGQSHPESQHAALIDGDSITGVPISSLFAQAFRGWDTVFPGGVGITFPTVKHMIS